MKTYFSVSRLHMVSKKNRLYLVCKKTLLLSSLLFFPFQICLPEWWSVVSNDDQFGFALTQCLQGLFVAQAKFAWFHNQSQTWIGRFQSFFLMCTLSKKEGRRKRKRNSLNGTIYITSISEIKVHITTWCARFNG